MTEVEITDDPARVDRARVHRWLSEDSYWAAGRTRAVQDAAVDDSRNYAAYADGEQVGYARLVTDGVTFGWLCDVYVDRAARGRGVGQALVARAVADARELGLGRLMLATADAHTLYAGHGFTALDAPERWMEWSPHR